MAKAYSEDLRSRVVKNYLNGMSKMDVITYFEIGIDTLNRWIRQHLNVGNLKPKQRTKYRERKFSDGDLINCINRNPSATLAEMARNFSVKPSSVQARLKALSITYKKKLFCTRNAMNKKGMNLLNN
jgi:transposase